MVVVCKAGARWPDGILPSRFPWFQPSMPQFSTIGLISRRDNRDIVDTLLLVANFRGKRPGTAVVVDESVDGLLGTHRFEVVPTSCPTTLKPRSTRYSKVTTARNHASCWKSLPTQAVNLACSARR